jgi:hypothetical protein
LVAQPARASTFYALFGDLSMLDTDVNDDQQFLFGATLHRVSADDFYRACKHRWETKSAVHEKFPATDLYVTHMVARSSISNARREPSPAPMNGGAPDRAEIKQWPFGKRKRACGFASGYDASQAIPKCERRRARRQSRSPL